MKFFGLFFVILYLIEYSKYKVDAIRNGTEVTSRKTYPFMASIKTTDGRKIWADQSSCSGVIVGDSKIVTAASCVKIFKTFTVYLGTLYAEEKDQCLEKLNPEQKDILTHPGYFESSPAHDIAVIKLPKPLKFMEKIDKKEMADKDRVIETGEEVTFLGFGTSRKYSIKKSLKYVDAKVMDPEKCYKMYVEKLGPKFYFSDDDMFCLERSSDNKPHSQPGDSGGPIISKRDNKLIGILVASSKDLPDICHKISYYRDFIDNPEEFIKAVMIRRKEYNERQEAESSRTKSSTRSRTKSSTKSHKK